MAEQDALAAAFEEHRGHLRAVAWRLLGSTAEADDAVQEAWFRLRRSDPGAIDNLPAWLTTVVARVSLDMLRARRTRREDELDEAATIVEPLSGDGDPVRAAEMADEVGPALMLVLDTLTPAERLAFVLHDSFGVPFDEIALIVDRTPDATRQLASRARRRVRAAAATDGPPLVTTDHDRQREVVSAYLLASRSGDFDALLAVLDPDIVVRADAASRAMGMDAETRGVTAVLKTWLRSAAAARRALLDGVFGAAWAPGGQLRAVLRFTVAGDRVTAIDLVADPDRLAAIRVELLPGDLVPRVRPSPRRGRAS